MGYVVRLASDRSLPTGTGNFLYTDRALVATIRDVFKKIPHSQCLQQPQPNERPARTARIGLQPINDLTTQLERSGVIHLRTTMAAVKIAFM
jgi:hypothetical protein